jgi:hypothetical protein
LGRLHLSWQRLTNALAYYAKVLGFIVAVVGVNGFVLRLFVEAEILGSKKVAFPGLIF